MPQGLECRVNQNPIGKVVSAKLMVTCPIDALGNQPGLTDPVDLELAIHAYPPDSALLHNHGRTTGNRTPIPEFDFAIADNLGQQTHHVELTNAVVVDWKLISHAGPGTDIGSLPANKLNDLLWLRLKCADVTLHANGKTQRFCRPGVQAGR